MELVHFNFAKDVIEGWASKRPEGLALWCVDETLKHQQKLTFAQLAVQLRKAAGFFASQGIQRGDRVLIILQRVPQWWVAMLGLTRLGAIPIPGTPQLTARDIKYRLKTAEAKAIITDADGAARVDGFDGLKIMVGDSKPGWISFDSGVREAAEIDPKPTLAGEPGIIFFTSGTTGAPKMVLHTQASYGMGHKTTGELWLDLKPGEVHWNMSDTGWAKTAWSSLFGPWHMGACIFAVDTAGKFDPSMTVRTLAEFPIATWCAPPTALRLVVRQDLSKVKFPALRHCVSAGEPLNPEVVNAWKKATGLTIYEAYGQTETVLLVGNFRSMNKPIRLGSMGVASPGLELAVVGPDFKEVPVGHEGQMAVRVKPHRPLGVFKEYWRNPDENSARFQGDWYLTGDMVRKDEDGYFWFVSRADDVIKSSGYRIGPFEVESALVEHPSVLEAAVVGKPDPTRGMIVKAFIVLRDGHKGSEELIRDLQNHCKRVTAPYKYPREVQFMTELPKTPSGKIRRVELRQKA